MTSIAGGIVDHAGLRLGEVEEHASIVVAVELARGGHGEIVRVAAYGRQPEGTYLPVETALQ